MQSLPGVAQALGAKKSETAGKAEKASQEGPQAIVFEGTGSSPAGQARTESLRQEFEHDLKQNSGLAKSLAKAGIPTDSRGLAAITNKANRHPKEFSAVVSASKDVAISLGKNPGAAGKLEASISSFAVKADIKANNTGDMSYLLARIAATSTSSAVADVRASVKQQKQNNQNLIKNMQQYEQDLVRSHAHMGDGDQKVVAESDFRVNSDNQVERVTDGNSDGGNKGFDITDPFGHRKAIRSVFGLGSNEAKTESVLAPFSQSKPVRMVQMDKSNLWAEIKETRQHIAELKRANSSIGQGGRPKSVSVEWFTDPAKRAIRH